MPHQRERNAVKCESRCVMEGCHRFAIRISYDGSGYKGFQSQPHGNTIQDDIEKRLGSMVRRRVRIFAAGRTDTGVHAMGQVITVDLAENEILRFTRPKQKNEEHDGDRTVSQTDLNTMASILSSALRLFECNQLKGSISAQAATFVPHDFDPRFSCVWKRYVYTISCNGVICGRSPFLVRYAWQLEEDLETTEMIRASKLLEGEHDFQWLSIFEVGEERSSVRKLKLSVKEEEHSSLFGQSKIIKISATCDFFLYKMVRRIVGVLVSIGQGKVDLAALETCIQEQDFVHSERSADKQNQDKLQIPDGLLQTAPPNGLCLEHVQYDSIELD